MADKTAKSLPILERWKLMFINTRFRTYGRKFSFLVLHFKMWYIHLPCIFDSTKKQSPQNSVNNKKTKSKNFMPGEDM